MPEDRDFIPFHRALIGDDDINAVIETLKTGWITTGPKVKEFEAAFAEKLGVKHAVAVSSCTAAMHLAVASLGLKPGDEVITTPYTFVATGEAIMYQGAKPVFVDVQPGDANIDPERIEAAVTDKTVGIMPVHIAGIPAAMDDIMKIAQLHDFWVVEDCAHSVETVYKGRPSGTIGNAGAFSFYATKNITTAEGGMVITDDEDLADRIRHRSLHGMSRDAWKRYTSTGSWYYEITTQGYKYNLPDVLATLGLAQFRHIDEWHRIRTSNAARMSEAFTDHPALITPEAADDTAVAWHLYPLRLKLDRLSIDRAQFIEELRARGVGSSVHFIPLHLHPLFQERFGYAAGQFPVAEAFYEAEVSLPLYPDLSDDEVSRIIETVIGIADEYGAG
jgi:dTDP-4-amino-4,6-dideoxygalactose transaminase